MAIYQHFNTIVNLVIFNMRRDTGARIANTKSAMNHMCCREMVHHVGYLL